MKTSVCKKIKCGALKKRNMNNNFECVETGKLPGNMTTCPKGII